MHHHQTDDDALDLGPSFASDTYNLLRLLHWAKGGLDVRVLVRRAQVPPDRLRAAVNEALVNGRVRVRCRQSGRLGVPVEVGGIARVALTRLGRRRGEP